MYRVKHENDHSFTVQHPDGSHFSVAKQGLSKGTQDKIRAYANGGEVDPATAIGVDPNLLSPQPNLTPMQQDNAATESTPWAPPTDAGESQTKEIMQSMGVKQPPTIPVSGSALTKQGATAGDGATGSDPVPAEQQVGIPKIPTIPKASADPLAQAQGLEQRGVMDKMRAEQGKSEEDRKVYDSQITSQQIANSQFQKEFAERNAETEKLFKDALTSKVDPNRYWQDHSKLIAGIGLILGGIGGQGNGNAAADMINKNIERDIEAQKADISNKNSLLSHNLARTNNMMQAEAITRSQLSAMGAAQLQKSAAMAGTPMAKANAEFALGQLKKQALGENFKAAQMKAVSAISSGGQGGYVPEEALPDEVRKRVVIMPNGQQRLARTDDDVKEVKTKLETAGPLMSILDRLDALGPSALVPNSAAAQQAQALRGQAVAKINEFNKINRLTPEDEKLMLQSVNDPERFSSLVGGKGRSDALRKIVSDQLESSLSQRIEGYKSAFKPKSEQRFTKR